MEKDIELQYKIGSRSIPVVFHGSSKVSLYDISDKDKDGNFTFKEKEGSEEKPTYTEVRYNWKAYEDAWYFGRILTDGKMCVQIRKQKDGTYKTCNGLHDPTPEIF